LVGGVATAHLIHGFLGTGKTTFARRLERDRPAVRYSPDEWMVRLHGIDPPEAKFAEYLAAVFDIMNQHWPRVLACGADVVLDFGFWTRVSRDEARARATAVGAEIRLYALSCPDAVGRARCRDRNTRLDGSLFIAANTYDVLRARFEPLSADESAEHIATDSPASPA
jgi:predicted kinase